MATLIHRPAPQRVSVITVSLNAADHLRGAVDSVLAQTYPNIEYVVIDGGSKDGTVETINGYGDRISYFVSEPDRGIYHAMNKGIDASTGDVLFFLNADDRFHDDKVVADVMSVFAQLPALEIVYGNLIWTIRGEVIYKKHPPVIGREYLARRTVSHQALFCKRLIFETTGKFAEQYRIISDYEWMLRVFLRDQRRYRYYDRDIAVMGTEGLSRTTNWEHERLAVMRRHFGTYEILRYRRLPRWFQKTRALLRQTFRGGET